MMSGRFSLPGKIFLSAGILLLVLLPIFPLSGFIVHIASLILLWTMICLSLNLIFGYAGQLSLAHGGLFGMGAYTYAILAGKLSLSFWLAFPLGGLAAGLTGLLIGVPSLRLKGAYFVIITLGFNIILVSVIEHLNELTGGVVGLVGIPAPSKINLIFLKLDFSSKTAQYYLILFFLLIFWTIMVWIRNSLWGRSLVSIKEDEDLCRSLGIDTMKRKVWTFVLSSILAGLGGGLYASTMGILTPQDASFHVGFDALVFLTVGGIGTIIGTILGPALMIVISELMQSMVEVRLLVNGLALIVLIIFMPQGIVGGTVALWKRYYGRSE
jgi:branched-chain amino acid transport system permease protein